jgi:hypothetical protein
MEKVEKAQTDTLNYMNCCCSMSRQIQFPLQTVSLFLKHPCFVPLNSLTFSVNSHFHCSLIQISVSRFNLSLSRDHGESREGTGREETVAIELILFQVYECYVYLVTFSLHVLKKKIEFSAVWIGEQNLDLNYRS